MLGIAHVVGFAAASTSHCTPRLARCGPERLCQTQPLLHISSVILTLRSKLANSQALRQRVATLAVVLGPIIFKEQAIMVKLQPGQTLYDAIGVTREATASEIRKAYHKLALQLHPDKNKDDEEAKERFQTLQKIYAVLSDPDKCVTLH